jgi:alanine-alpha-ketoisovalerate/valine-pyruvate aminotransferase
MVNLCNEYNIPNKNKIFMQFNKFKKKVKSFNSVRIYYNRYADNFIIGIIGTKEFSEIIKMKIANFLKEELVLNLSEDNIKVSNVVKQGFYYLGYYINSNNSLKVSIKLPKDKLIDQIIDLKFASAKNKPIAYNK